MLFDNAFTELMEKSFKVFKPSSKYEDYSFSSKRSLLIFAEAL